MATPEYSYPEDEFDTLGNGRTPQGAHRSPRPRWRVILPFVLVLVLAPALAYLGVSYLASRGEETAPGTAATPTAEASVAAEPSDGAGQTPGEAAPTPEAGSTPATDPAQAAGQPDPAPDQVSDAATVPRDVGVIALNGTSEQGLAGHAAARLERDGFTSVATGNARSSVPTSSTVFYNNPALAASAEQVAEVLGIADVVELASATPSIAVVLRADYET